MEGYWKAYVELNGKSMEYAKEVFERMAMESDRVVWYYHPKGRRGKGPHFHALLFNNKKGDDTFRSRLKEAFGVSKSQYGVSDNYDRGVKMNETTVRNYVKYMTKGEFEPFVNKGFDIEWLAECKREWKPDNVLQVGDLTVNVSGDVKKNRVTNRTIAIEAYGLYNERPNAINEIKERVIDMIALMDIVAEVCKKYNKGRNYDNVAKICQDVLCDLNHGYWCQKVLSRL